MEMWRDLVNEIAERFDLADTRRGSA